MVSSRALHITIAIIAVAVVAIAVYVLALLLQARAPITAVTTSPTTISTPTTTTSASVGEEYVTVVDILNRTAKVPKNLTRIVAIGPGALRLVVYLNATNLVAGVEQVEKQWGCIGRDYAMAICDTIQRLPVIGAGGPRSPPDPEAIMRVKPQLIIMSRIYVDLYPPDRLEKETGVPVLVIDYGAPGYLQIDGFKKALTILGKALGREERAKQLIAYIDSVVRDLQSRVRGVAEKPSVYIAAVSYTGAQPFTASQSRFAPLQLLNTSSIVDSLKPGGGYINVDFEYILKAQPSYIFIDENNLRIVLDDFAKNRDQYCSLKAFREGRVYGVIPFNYYHTNVATALANAYYIGKILYPQQFADVDPVQKADEIFTIFVGKSLYQEFVKGGYPGFVNLSNMFVCG
jgi:iron complex transport system substrate-binding protein